MNKVSVMKCSIDDVEHLKKISEMTFLETFADTNSKEDMDGYLQENFSEEQMVKELSHEGSSFYLVNVEGEPAGYMKLNTGSAQTEEGHPNALEVQRIYILERYKGNGIGKKLIHMAIDSAKNMKQDYVWLGVWEHNYPAIKFYEKLGFEKFGQHTFMLGEDAQIDNLMKRDL